MNDPKIVPTIGRIVVYNTTEVERQAMVASNQNDQKQLPALIVSTWGNQPDSAVNLAVFLDGDGSPFLRKTSISQGKSPGNWEWPTIKKAEEKTEGSESSKLEEGQAGAEGEQTQQ